ncbi:MAG TPA: hypothetical protein DCL45_03550 [Chloroflexi bacterium]|nr:hypothetical protein [Chloroflexota bacterium]
MPNHVRVVVKCVGGNALPTIVHGWKSFSATEANRRLGRSGRFWMPDYFDRVIRDDDQAWHEIECVNSYPAHQPVYDGRGLGMVTNPPSRSMGGRGVSAHIGG